MFQWLLISVYKTKENMKIPPKNNDIGDVAVTVVAKDMNKGNLFNTSRTT